MVLVPTWYQIIYYCPTSGGSSTRSDRNILVAADAHAACLSQDEIAVVSTH